MFQNLVETIAPGPQSENLVLLLGNSLVALLAILVTYKAFRSYQTTQQASLCSKSNSSSVCNDKGCFRCQKGTNLNDVQDADVLIHLRASLKTFPNLISILDEYEATNQWENLEHVSFILNGIDLPRSTLEDSLSNPYASDFCLLESQIKCIADEFNFLYTHHPEVWKVNQTPKGAWEICFLINQGMINRVITDLCPLTYSIVKLLPNLMDYCLYGNVAFSIMHGKSKIEEHTGPTNTRARCHLGLIVPRGCKLFVDKDVYDWGQGKCIVFDDSQLHHVTNDSSEMRVVLIVDLWNCNLSAQERKLLSLLFSPY